MVGKAGPSPNVTGGDFPTPSEWSTIIDGCCNKSGLTSGCCLAPGNESVVEALTDDVVCQGYEFPILRRMKADGTAPPPEHPGPVPMHHPHGGLVPMDHPSNRNDPSNKMFQGVNREHSASESSQGGGPATPREAGAQPKGNASQVQTLGGPTMAELERIGKEPDRPKQPVVETRDVEVKEASAEAKPPSAKDAKTKREKTVLDEASVMKDTWWCSYCCCAGIGCGRPAFTRLLTKCFCCRTVCEHASLMEDDHGCQQCICSCCFWHYFCQVPGRPGHPRCMCCSEMIMGCGQYPRKEDPHKQVAHVEEGGAPPMFEYLTFEAFTCCYCCCCGCSCKEECLSCCTVTQICCCLSCKCEDAIPSCGPDGCCTLLQTCGSCYTQCACLPIKEQNPMCACCGTKLRKHNHVRGAIGGNKSEAPMQESMD